MHKQLEHKQAIQQARANWIPQKTMIRELPLPRKTNYWRIKRVGDVLWSTLALILVSPIMLLTALAIVIDDPHGGPIYSQMRCGRGGKPFRMYKFRSMFVNADKMIDKLQAQNEMSGPAFKMKNDPRITRVGKIIRKLNIDELPQFWNVLKGDMSIVGPRPPLPREVALYDEYQFQRLYATPGMTCYWQIQPHRNELSFDEWLELDIKYIVERSFLVDINIMLQTGLAIFRRTES